MPALIGIGLAIGVMLFARVSGFDRDRAFYPVVTMVVASYYVLFAVMAGGGTELATELFVAGLFAAAAVIGFRTSLWVVAAVLAAHGLFDFLRDEALPGRGVPEWWPDFCLGFDLAAGAGLAVLLRVDRQKV